LQTGFDLWHVRLAPTTRIAPLQTRRGRPVRKCLSVATAR
jgi:hypothetical protein